VLWLPEQNDRLHARFAGFRTLLLEPRRAVWEGVLKPTSQAYDVRIDFQLPAHFALNATTYEYYPRVYVLRPELEQHPEYEPDPARLVGPAISAPTQSVLVSAAEE